MDAVVLVVQIVAGGFIGWGAALALFVTFVPEPDALRAPRPAPRTGDQVDVR